MLYTTRKQTGFFVYTLFFAEMLTAKLMFHFNASKALPLTDKLRVQFPFNKLIGEEVFWLFFFFFFLVARIATAGPHFLCSNNRRIESTMRQIGDIINLTQMRRAKLFKWCTNNTQARTHSVVCSSVYPSIIYNENRHENLAIANGDGGANGNDNTL